MEFSRCKRPGRTDCGHSGKQLKIEQDDASIRRKQSKKKRGGAMAVMRQIKQEDTDTGGPDAAQLMDEDTVLCKEEDVESCPSTPAVNEEDYTDYFQSIVKLEDNLEDDGDEIQCSENDDSVVIKTCDSQPLIEETAGIKLDDDGAITGNESGNLKSEDYAAITEINNNACLSIMEEESCEAPEERKILASHDEAIPVQGQNEITRWADGVVIAKQNHVDVGGHACFDVVTMPGPVPTSITGIVRYINTHIDDGIYDRQKDTRGECSKTRRRLRELAKRKPGHIAIRHYVETKDWTPPTPEALKALVGVIQSYWPRPAE